MDTVSEDKHPVHSAEERINKDKGKRDDHVKEIDTPKVDKDIGVSIEVSEPDLEINGIETVQTKEELQPDTPKVGGDTGVGKEVSERELEISGVETVQTKEQLQPNTPKVGGDTGAGKEVSEHELNISGVETVQTKEQLQPDTPKVGGDTGAGKNISERELKISGVETVQAKEELQPDTPKVGGNTGVGKEVSEHELEISGVETVQRIEHLQPGLDQPELESKEQFNEQRASSEYKTEITKENDKEEKVGITNETEITREKMAMKDSESKAKTKGDIKIDIEMNDKLEDLGDKRSKGSRGDIATNNRVAKAVDMDIPSRDITATLPVPKEQKTGRDNGKNEDLEVNQENQARVIAPEILKVLTGLCPFDELPPLPKKVVRIFVSSTFTDTKEERNALMQHVYPKLADYCREKHGLEFQIVDMRWGVPEQASDNHTTSELCIQEIKKCQEVSVGPNFVAIVGDKYGYRPIPRSVEEGLFQTLASSEVEGWPLVEEWYKKDTNAVPAVYILQPISSKIQNLNNMENAELRQIAWDEWSRTSQQLSVVLRRAADRCHEESKVNLTQKQLFHMSVTENEITAGITEGRSDPSESCYCVIRKICDIEHHLGEVKAPRFIDVNQEKAKDVEAVTLLDNLKERKVKHHIPQSNVTMLDIEWSASGACMSLENYQDVNVLKYAQKFYKERKIGLAKHKEYIDSFCNEFFAKIRRLIRDGSIKQMKMYNDLTTEILQHSHLAKMRCDVFEGREDILSETKNYLKKKDTSFPLVIYGNSGCGKTSVMAKVYENVSNRQDTNYRHNCFTVVARFLGTSTKTSNVHQLLVSMCMQLSIIFETPWKEPQQFSELVKSFYRLLENATPLQPILLLLDSIDQLMPVYNAYKLHWLPDEFPPNVKLIASTIDEGYNILGAFQEKYASVGLKTTQVNPLGEKLGLEIILRWLKKDSRQVTDGQRTTVQEVLTKCSLPLYARIVYDHVRLWRSYDIPTVEQLDTTVKGAINKLFQQMEDKFGKHPVQHCLSYLTASRYGLSEAELEHILSLDDMLLNKIFRLWNPPVRRIPPLIWTRIRSEVQSYIVERSADDQLVLYWYHRQFILTTKSRYLADSVFSRHITDTLIEYFSGKWGGGKEKPFIYTNSQMRRFGLDKPESKADRKVPSQPYWTEHISFGKMETRYNKRKLSELPYHLLKNKDYEQLKEQAFFSFEWLLGKMNSASVQQMIEEVDIFMRADKVMKQDPETKLLYANLQLVRPYIITYPDSLSYELSGRLAKYVGKYPHITSLMKQCDCMGVNYCPLIPLTTCFETASLGFQQNFKFRSKEPWHEGGTFTCSPNFKTLYVFDYNNEGLPVISSWDVESGEKVHEILIEKVKSEELRFTTDLYLQAECSKSGKELLGFYIQRMDTTYQKKTKPACHFTDVIDVESGKVKKTYESYFWKHDYVNLPVYLTENYMCITHGWKKPLINFTDDRFSSFNSPTLLSADEKFFIMCGKDKTVLRFFETKEFIAEFDVPEHQKAVTGSDDFSVIAMMGAETRDISIFDLSNKLQRSGKEGYQLLKSRHVFKLDEKTADSVAVVFKPVLKTLEDGRIQETTSNRVIMKISKDKRHLVVTFAGWKWMAYLWNLNIDKYSTKFVGKYSAKFVGPITPFRMQPSSRYPVFNHDSSALVYSMGNRKVLIVSADTVEVINEYDMKQDIKDICVSKVSNKVAVLLQKSVLLLDVMRDGESVMKGKSRPTVTQLTEVLLPRETIHGVVQSEIIQKTSDESVELEEIEDLALAADTDRVASASSRSSHAVEKYYTPNGLRVLHLHRKAQVIDTVHQDIKYSPKAGETILRSIVSKDGATANEVLPIPDVSKRVSSGNNIYENDGENFDKAMLYGRRHIPSHKENLKEELLKPVLTRSLSKNAIILRQGDRIVNENNKIKFRVTMESEGQLQVMVVPSVITIYTVEEMKLNKLQRLTMYQDTVIHVGNAYFVTAKTNSLGHFVKVYDQVRGKSLAVHDMLFPCECARFSEDEECLFVIDRSLTVKVLQGPHYMGVLRTFSIMEGELSSAFVVKDIGLFQNNKDAILVKYGPEGLDIFVRSRYIFYDFISNQRSEEMNVSRRFEDVSCDGRFGVDTELKLYDLQSGKVFAEVTSHSQHINYEGILERRIRYTEAAVANEMIARISDDNKYVVYLNKNEDTLHLLHIAGRKLQRIASCYAHAPNILPEKGLSLRYNSSVALLKASKRLIPIALVHSKRQDYSYATEYARSKSILSRVYRKDTERSVPVKLPSIFEQRKLMLQQEDMVKQKEVAKKLSKSHKPSLLVVGEPILCSNIFKSEKFSPNLLTKKMSVQNVDDAFIKLRADTLGYDAIVLQLITEDVTMYDVAVCVKKVSVLVEMARRKARVVIISYAPGRSDSKELSDKIREVNEKLGKIYTSSCSGGKHLHFCKNSNLSDIGGKPIAKFFKDGVQLSVLGIKKICKNFKEALAPLLGVHHI